MSDLLNQASLVMVPSGYKEDTVYSVVPSDGSGDLSFTRASNGTRVNSAGLVEVVAWNLLQQSNTFNTTWAPLSGASVTGGQAGYDGTNNAWLLSKSAVGGFIYQSSNSYNGQYTISVYAKANTLNYIRLNGNADTDSEGIFNLSDGTINYQLNCVAEITSVGGGWYRCSITSSDVILDYVNIYPAPQSASSGSIYIQNAQLNIGALKPYFPTTDRLNVPRLTYQNGGGGCPSLLLEKQSTNLALYSEEFDNAYWTKTRSTISANQAISPDGTQNADKLIEDAVSGTHFADRTISGLTASVVHSFSIFAKKGEREFVNVQCVTTGNSVYINLNNGAITISGGYTSSTVKVESHSNSWYRITVNDTPVGTSLRYIVVTAIDSTTNSYLGNGTSGIYVWGAQLEASSYPTSYIPTTSSSATRVADACSKTGISSLIGQTSGSVFFEGTIESIGTTNRRIISLSDGTNANTAVVLNLSGTLDLQFAVASSSVTQASITASSAFTLNQKFKFAFAYANNDFAFYVNGAQIGVDNSGSLPASLTNLVFGRGPLDLLFEGKVNQAIIFPTRLTNAELAQLTA